MPSTAVEHVMPAGYSCWYRDSDHAYWERSIGEKCSGRIPGVSTISKYADPSSDGLMDWATTTTLEGLIQLADTDLHNFNSGDELWNTLNNAGLTWRHLRNKAGKRGQYAHDALEALAAGKDFTWPTDEAEREYVNAVEDWWADREPLPILTEQVVYSREYNFAGRFDLLCILDEQRVLVDLKTSRHVGAPFHVQLAGYALALSEAGFQKADKRIVLQAKPDGTYKEVEGCGTTNDFLNCLAIYNSSKRIKSEARRAA